MNPTIVMTKMGRQLWSDPAKSAPIISRTPMGKLAGKHFVMFCANANVIVELRITHTVFKLCSADGSLTH